MGLTDDALNQLLRIVLWGLHLDAETAGDLVHGSDVLYETIREGDPRLRVYYTIEDDGPDGADTCWLTWLEIDPEWAAARAVAVADGRAVHS